MSIEFPPRMSLNGFKSGEAILGSVAPSAEDAFRVALTAVKFWATRRKIYGTVLGFLGGISTAVMMARQVFSLKPIVSTG